MKQKRKRILPARLTCSLQRALAEMTALNATHVQYPCTLYTTGQNAPGMFAERDTQPVNSKARRCAGRCQTPSLRQSDASATSQTAITNQSTCSVRAWRREEMQDSTVRTTKADYHSQTCSLTDSVCRLCVARMRCRPASKGYFTTPSITLSQLVGMHPLLRSQPVSGLLTAPHQLGLKLHQAPKHVLLHNNIHKSNTKCATAKAAQDTHTQHQHLHSTVQPCYTNGLSYYGPVGHP